MTASATIPSAGDSAAEWVDLAELLEWQANPKDHSGEHVGKIRASIDTFGWLTPLVANRRTKTLIAGHGRRLAAIERGDTVVPVRFVDLSDEDAELAALADNRLNEIAGYDDRKLADILRRHQADDRVRLAIAGYDDAYVAAALRRVDPPKPKKPRAPRVADGQWTVIRADLRTERDLIDLDDESFDAVLCDPPYELGFMGKKWDASGVAFDVAMWKWIASKLRPGAPILAFGGTRTYHRMTCAIEDAGFEIRDCLTWLYGSGFPKSHDVAKSIDKANGHHRGQAGKVESSNVAMGGPNYARTDKGEPITDDAQAWDGYGTALKPAWEPCVLARKPLDGTIVENVTKHGVGPLNIDGTRIAFVSESDKSSMNAGVEAIRARGGVIEGSWKNSSDLSGANPISDNGRWPANVILDEDSATLLDAQTGNRPGMSGGGKHRDDYEGGMFGGIDSTNTARGDNGGASRFFYTAKVSRGEREDGIDGGVGALRDGGRGSASKNPHPTLKPIALTQYLASLILQPRIDRPLRILVPFSGAGSEMIGALLAGWDEVVGIERESEYVDIAKMRLQNTLVGT